MNILKESVTTFDMPILLVGTDFQQRVWQQLQKVAYGETASYLQLAKDLGDVKAIRAVATRQWRQCIINYCSLSQNNRQRWQVSRLCGRA